MFRNSTTMLVTAIATCAALSSSCASDATGAAKVSAKLLDPAAAHEGKTYAQWAEQWVRYSYAYHPPECANPFEDTTGASCDLDQDPESPTFYLVGAFGGVARRKCTIPKEKAIFLPLVSVAGDNAGVSADKLASDADLKAYVEGVYNNVTTDRLWLTIDGQPVTGLALGGLRSAPYELTIPAGMNSYTCNGTDGVEGTFKGYVSGYFAMLDPLPVGKHTLAFGVKTGVDLATGDPSKPSFMLDVSYELTIE
jgi:hypothetical protein